MKKEKGFLLKVSVGMGTAIVASLCCTGPILALLLGIGGIAGSFAVFAELKPVFLGLSLLAIALLWYPKIRSLWSKACETCSPEKRLRDNPYILLVLSALILGLSTFPYYSQYLLGHSDQRTIAAHDYQVVLQVKGMTCGGCESLIENKLSSQKGIAFVKANYKTGQVKVRYDQAQISLSTIKNIITQLGYNVL